jgi:hypothetical protein
VASSESQSTDAVTHAYFILAPATLLKGMTFRHPQLLGSFIIIWLLKQEIGRELLVLVAGEVGLNGLVPIET